MGVAMRIGELSGRLGVSAANLRHYESLGLLGKPRRSPGGYRLYDGAAEKRLRFILRAKALTSAFLRFDCSSNSARTTAQARARCRPRDGGPPKRS